MMDSFFSLLNTETGSGAWCSCCVSEQGDRDSQQDATLVLHSDHAVLAVVADGAGGHADGALASSTAVNSLKELWERTLSAGVPAKQAAQELSDGIAEAHRSILQTADGNHNRCGKCAIVVLYLCGGRYTIAHAGDCRCYHSVGKKWVQRTQDDSVLQILLNKGMVTEEEAVNHPDQSVLTQALGGANPPRPHISQGSCGKGSFLLCCDGLWNQLPAFREAAAWDCPPGSHSTELRNKVEQAIQAADGDSDNVSAIWVYREQDPAAPTRNFSGAVWAATAALLLGLVTALFFMLNSDSPQQSAEKDSRPADTAQPAEDDADITESQKPAEEEPQPIVTEQPTEEEPQPIVTEQPTEEGSTVTEPQQPTEEEPQPIVTEQPTEEEPAEPAPEEESLEIIGKPITLAQHPIVGTKVAFSADGQAIAIGYRGITLAARNRYFLPSEGEVTTIAFSPDGKYMAFGNKGNTAVVAELTRGNVIYTTEHSDWVKSVAFSPVQHYLAVGSAARTVRISDFRNGRTIMHLALNHSAESVVFSPDGQYLAIGDGSGQVMLAEVATGNMLWHQQHEGSVHGMAFSPDGKHLATGGADATLRLLDAATGAVIREIRHGGSINSVAYSADGRFLATCGKGNAVCITESATGRLVQQIPTGAELSCVTFSPDGRYLAAVIPYEKVLLYRLNGAAPAATPRGSTPACGGSGEAPDTPAAATGNGVQVISCGRISFHVAFSENGIVDIFISYGNRSTPNTKKEAEE